MEVSETGSCWRGVGLSHASSVVVLMVMDTSFGNAPFLFLLRSVKILSFMISWEWIRVIGLGVCFGENVLPLGRGCCAGCCKLLECALGSYSSRFLLEWNFPDEFDADDVAFRVPADPDV